MMTQKNHLARQEERFQHYEYEYAVQVYSTGIVLNSILIVIRYYFFILSLYTGQRKWG